MEIKQDWNLIRAHFNRTMKSSLHVSVGSVDENNCPTVTPIGSLFLNKDQKGFYFEKFTRNLPANTKQNNTICVLGVNSGLWFWFKSMYRGYFKKNPALKLYGKIGERRKASAIELSRLKKRTKLFKISKKGYNYLWGDMEFVREVSFYKVEKIKLARMTD